MSDSFKVNLKVIDEWEYQYSKAKYRLVDLGAGPRVLQIFEDGKWREETRCYVHGELCNRIKHLSQLLDQQSKVFDKQMNRCMQIVSEVQGGKDNA